MKRYSPVTNSLRQLCLIDYQLLNKNKKISCFLYGNRKNSGRNNHGHITIKHRGGGVNKLYTNLDFFGRIYGIPFKIMSIDYDSYRSAFISLIRYQNGLYCYRLSIYKTFLNDQYISYNNIPDSIKTGDGSLIRYISAGSLICNYEMIPYCGFQLSRSAGTFSLLLKQEKSKAFLKLSSGDIVCLSNYCMGFLGSISNRNHRYEVLGKAGRVRHMGFRPTVRGVAMNPIDHPHGGGEGKKSKRSFPRSPWGKRYKKLKKVNNFY